MRSYIIVVVVGCSLLAAFQVRGQVMNDYIERPYYQGAKAQNDALAAARYAEEAYFYAHQANNRADLNDFRADLDTVLFYIRKSDELAQTSMSSALAKDTSEVYLTDGIARLAETDRVLRHVYPFRDLKVMQQYVELMLTELMNTKISFYTASLYLMDPDAEFAEEEFVYSQLDLDKHVARLDADEAAFADLVLDLEDKMNSIDKRIDEIREELKHTTDPEKRAELENELERLLAEQESVQETLDKAGEQLQVIRDLQRQRDEESGDSESAPTADSKKNESNFETDKHGYYDDKSVGVNEPLPDGLVYRIQLGYFFESDGKDAFHGLFPITGEDLGDGKIRYYAGMFTSYKDATRAKNYIREKRIGDAFVVPYLDGKKIDVNRAIELERKLK